jgi:hypothetical protein
MVTTEYNICSQALALLGEGAITNFTASDKAVVCGVLYPNFMKHLLSMHPWRFNRKKSASLTATTAPTFGYEYAFTLPSDLLAIVHAFDSTATEVKPQERYERFGAVIHTAFTPCYLDYLYDIDEDLWPFWFVEFAATAFAARIAIPVTEDPARAELYNTIAFGTPSENNEGGLYRACKKLDSKQQPLKPFPAQSLIKARFSGMDGAR